MIQISKRNSFISIDVNLDFIYQVSDSQTSHKNANMHHA